MLAQHSHNHDGEKLLQQGIRQLKSAIPVTFLLLFFFTSSVAVTFPDKPPESDYFVDNANIIQEKERNEINAIASKILSEEKIPIYVVTIPSLSHHAASSLGIEGYATELFNKWGIGFQDRNYGILLLVSKGDRKARIELGADWGREHDYAAQDIMDNLIIRQFKNANFSLGILDGVRGLDAMARGLALPKPTTPWWYFPLLIISIIGLVMLIINLFKTGRSGWAWALIVAIGVILFFILRNAGSGGSGGGFGGGSSGGGGASGSW